MGTVIYWRVGLSKGKSCNLFQSDHVHILMLWHMQKISAKGTPAFQWGVGDLPLQEQFIHIPCMKMSQEDWDSAVGGVAFCDLRGTQQQ